MQTASSLLRNFFQLVGQIVSEVGKRNLQKQKIY